MAYLWGHSLKDMYLCIERPPLINTQCHCTVIRIKRKRWRENEYLRHSWNSNITQKCISKYSKRSEEAAERRLETGTSLQTWLYRAILDLGDHRADHYGDASWECSRRVQESKINKGCTSQQKPPCKGVSDMDQILFTDPRTQKALKYSPLLGRYGGGGQRAEI